MRLKAQGNTEAVTLSYSNSWDVSSSHSEATGGEIASVHEHRLVVIWLNAHHQMLNAATPPHV